MQPQPPPPAYKDIVRTFAQIGLTSFGGPAGQIAMMHRILVDEKRWLEERTYLLALNFCTLLPGPEAMQLATYAGWRLHGLKGGLTAGLLFVAPGAVLILLLSMLYAAYGATPFVSAAFLGIKAAVLAIVIEALLRIARRSLSGPFEWAVAALAFIAIYFAKVPFPVIILAAGLVGFWRGRGEVGNTALAGVRVPFAQTLRTMAVWLTVWLAPLALLVLTLGSEHVLSKLAWFFSKLAVVTFGGAYAVLAYMAQDVVQQYGWLRPSEMLDGLGLAETTPGPLILVTEFVGYLAAYRHGEGTPWIMGVAGALVVLWATFAPCFLWIFAGAPYVEMIAGMPRLKSALSAITAAVVGVILNLSVWFAMHVLFEDVQTAVAGPFAFEVPVLSSLDGAAAALALLAAALLFLARRGIMTTLGICAGISLAIWALTGLSFAP